MKRIVFFILVMHSVMSSAQRLDGYNCVSILSHVNDEFKIEKLIEETFLKKGFKVIRTSGTIHQTLDERLTTLICSYEYTIGNKVGSTVSIKLKNILGEDVLDLKGYGQTWTIKSDMNKACRRALKPVSESKYSYKSSLSPKLPIPTTNKASWTEAQIKDYLSKSEIDPIEGVYKNINGTYYKFAILKESDVYYAVIMETECANWFVGSVKVVFEKLKANLYNTCFYDDNYSKKETISELDKDGILKMGSLSYVKIYPIEK